MDSGPRPAAAPVARGLADGRSGGPRPRQGERGGDRTAPEANTGGVAPVRDWQDARKGTVTEDGGTPSLAVPIDADNTSARYAQAIFEGIVKLGKANVRRIYGDFAGSRLAAWDPAIRSLAILQHRQRNNTRGKNAADIALVIDAMDLLHKQNRLDGVCLVGSDSDFTRLAQRLREDRLAVYGFGERKTPEAFRNACSRFIYLENILEAEPETGDAATGAARRKKKLPKRAVPVIAKAMEDGGDDGWVHLGTVGSRIQDAAPDIDPGSYGCANPSTLAEKSGGLEVRKGPGNAIHIRRKADAGGMRARAVPAKGGKGRAAAAGGSASAPRQGRALPLVAVQAPRRPLPGGPYGEGHLTAGPPAVSWSGRRRRHWRWRP